MTTMPFEVQEDIARWVFEEPAGAEQKMWTEDCESKHTPSWVVVKQPVTQSFHSFSLYEATHSDAFEPHRVMQITGLVHREDRHIVLTPGGASTTFLGRDHRNTLTSLSVEREVILTEINILAWERFNEDPSCKIKLDALDALLSIEPSILDRLIQEIGWTFHVRKGVFVTELPWLYQGIGFGLTGTDFPIQLLMDYLERVKQPFSRWEAAFYDQTLLASFDPSDPSWLERLPANNLDAFSRIIGFKRLVQEMLKALAGEINNTTGLLMAHMAYQTMIENGYPTLLAQKNEDTNWRRFDFPTDGHFTSEALWEITKRIGYAPLDEWPFTTLSHEGRVHFGSMYIEEMVPGGLLINY